MSTSIIFNNFIIFFINSPIFLAKALDNFLLQIRKYLQTSVGECNLSYNESTHTHTHIFSKHTHTHTS